MLQTVHDIAPKSSLAFRTGFISEGDFAQGIYQLQQAGCKVIADDITYITTPFFKDGLAAKAVNNVKALGVSYFSAAGNFGSKSYEAIFNPTAAPAGLQDKHTILVAVIFFKTILCSRQLYDCDAVGRFNLFAWSRWCIK